MSSNVQSRRGVSLRLQSDSCVSPFLLKSFSFSLASFVGGVNASGALLFNAVLHEKFAQEVTENDYLQDLLLDF